MEWGSYYLGNVFEEWPGEVRRPWNGTHLLLLSTLTTGQPQSEIHQIHNNVECYVHDNLNAESPTLLPDIYSLHIRFTLVYPHCGTIVLKSLDMSSLKVTLLFVT